MDLSTVIGYDWNQIILAGVYAALGWKSGHVLWDRTVDLLTVMVKKLITFAKKS